MKLKMGEMGEDGRGQARPARKALSWSESRSAACVEEGSAGLLGRRGGAGGVLGGGSQWRGRWVEGAWQTHRLLRLSRDRSARRWIRECTSHKL